MFGTVNAVLRFAAAALDALEGEGPLAGGELGWLVAPRPGGTLRAGFDGKSESGSSAGERAGPRTFGHLGFTGTSLWIDPDRGIAVALLTNRVHPTRENVKIREARPRVHDALFESAMMAAIERAQ
jgi:CubicO group peptidase (beta-lactamase class C family)